MKSARVMSQSMHGNLDEGDSFVSSTELDKRETGCSRRTYALDAQRRGGVLRRETIVAETKCVTLWNSDAIERLCRQRDNSRSTLGVSGREGEDVWWFRSWDEVRRQVASDRKFFESDLENLVDPKAGGGVFL